MAQPWMRILSAANDRVARYRRFAEACVRMTEDARYTEQKKLLVEMAETWIELAEEIGDGSDRP